MNLILLIIMLWVAFALFPPLGIFLLIYVLAVLLTGSR